GAEPPPGFGPVPPGPCAECSTGPPFAYLRCSVADAGKRCPRGGALPRSWSLSSILLRPIAVRSRAVCVCYVTQCPMSPFAVACLTRACVVIGAQSLPGLAHHPSQLLPVRGARADRLLGDLGLRPGRDVLGCRVRCLRALLLLQRGDALGHAPG